MMIKLNEVLADSFNGNGIFTNISNPIWANDFDSNELDIYFVSMYGNKIISPYIKHFLDDEGNISADDLIRLSNNIYAMRKSSWEHLYKAYVSEYNPIHNVDAYIEEEEDNTHNDTRVGNSSTDSSDSGNTTSNASATNNNNTTNTRSGFNSSGYVPDNKSDVKGGGTTNGSSTSSNTGNTTIDSNDVTNGAYNTKKTQRRFGNIGVTTSAQMIEGEKNVWKWDYIQTVMVDICKFIALSIYE